MFQKTTEETSQKMTDSDTFQPDSVLPTADDYDSGKGSEKPTAKRSYFAMPGSWNIPTSIKFLAPGDFVTSETLLHHVLLLIMKAGSHQRILL